LKTLRVFDFVLENDSEYNLFAVKTLRSQEGGGKMKSKVAIILATVAMLLSVAVLVGASPLARPNLQGGAPTVVSHQGQVMVDGEAYDGTGYFKFAVVNAAGDTTYWSNDGTLTGLGDDDHPQYTQHTTAETITGLWTFDRDPAAPFSVTAGSAVVTNLNADLLDGQHASAFAGATHNHAPADITPQGAGSNLDADKLDGQHGSYYQDANNINAGTLSTDRYSAYADLGAEGRLDNNDGNDLLTRSQADNRFNEPLNLTCEYTVLVDTTETYETTTMWATGDSFCFLAEVNFNGINQDHEAECDIYQSGGNWMLLGSHDSDSDAQVYCVARCIYW
jgi:hypothetical protein